MVEKPVLVSTITENNLPDSSKRIFNIKYLPESFLAGIFFIKKALRKEGHKFYNYRDYKFLLPTTGFA